MTTRNMGVLGLVVAVLVAISAVGQESGEKPRRGKDPFAKADANGDGKLTFEELSAARPGMTKEMFGGLDKDGDGFLTQNEKPGRPPRGQGRQGDRRGGPQFGEMFDRADNDGDQKVTINELSAVVPQITKERFSQLDKNGDGALTEDDFPPRGRGHGMPPGGLIEKADKDGDKKVTLEELSAVMPGMTE